MRTKIFGLMILGGLLIFASSCSKDEEDREEFIGTYNAAESFVFDGVNYQSSYSFTITKSTAATEKVILNGFGEFTGKSFEATISGKTMTIPQQTFVFDGESFGISGSGTKNGNVITYSYNVSFIGLSINVTGTANKL
jgi:hypothetical protein